MSVGQVVAVAKDEEHHFSKNLAAEIRVKSGVGVEGDAHFGVTVKHRSRVAKDPTQPNLRQVHLLHSELFYELREKGFIVGQGDLGENITTLGIDLLGLPKGTLLQIGETAVLEVTGLRNPCAQIERYQPGLLATVLGRGPKGELIRKAGIMTIVRVDGAIRAGDMIEINMPPHPHIQLEPV